MLFRQCTISRSIHGDNGLPSCTESRRGSGCFYLTRVGEILLVSMIDSDMYVKKKHRKDQKPTRNGRKEEISKKMGLQE